MILDGQMAYQQPTIIFNSVPLSFHPSCHVFLRTNTTLISFPQCNNKLAAFKGQLRPFSKGIHVIPLI